MQILPTTENSVRHSEAENLVAEHRDTIKMAALEIDFNPPLGKRRFAAHPIIDGRDSSSPVNANPRMNNR